MFALSREKFYLHAFAPVRHKDEEGLVRGRMAGSLDPVHFVLTVLRVNNRSRYFERRIRILRVVDVIEVLLSGSLIW